MGLITEKEGFINWGKNYFKIMLFKNFIIENLDFGEKGIMVLILEFKREGCEQQGFCNLKKALSTIEGL